MKWRKDGAIMTAEAFKFTLRISDEMNEKLKHFAEEEFMSRNQLINKAIKELINDLETKEKERK